MTVGMGGSGLYYGLEYSGSKVRDTIELSGAAGYADPDSYFLIGGAGPKFMFESTDEYGEKYYSFLVIPIRAGILISPLGTTFAVNAGALFKFGWLALELDLGFILGAGGFFGAGFGLNF